MKRVLAPVLALLLLSGVAHAACTNPPGIEGDQFYNTTYKIMQYCNGTAWVNMGSIGPGAYGSIGTLSPGNFCTTDGTMINCNTSAISLTSNVSGTLQAAQFPILTGDVTTAGGALATTVARINGVALGSTTATAGNLLIGSGTTWVSNAITGDVTITSGGVTAIGAAKVGVAMINASGTPSSSTYFRGDGTWSSIAASQWTTSGSDIYYSTGKIGIGTASPGNLLDIYSASAGWAARIRSTSNAGISLSPTDASAHEWIVESTGTGNSWGVGKFVVYDSTAAEARLLIDTAGHVGIGTTAPVLMSSSGAADTGLLVSNLGSGKVGGVGVQGNVTSSAMGGYHFYNNGSRQVSITGFYDGGATTSGLQVTTSNSGTVNNTALTIKGNGKVGIGPNATNPGEMLTIASTNGYSNIQTGYAYLGNAYSSQATILGFNAKANTAADSVLVGATDTVGYKFIRMDGSTGIQFHTVGGSVTAGGTASSERMRIDNSGNVGIGSTSPGYRLDVAANAANWGARIINANASGSGAYIQNANDANVAFGVLNAAGNAWGATFNGNGMTYLSSSGGYTQIGGSVRAPLFYDSDNTGYYVDPASYSNTIGLWRYYGYNGVEYDYNDAGYYVDPNGASRFNRLDFRYGYDVDNTAYYIDMDNTSRLNQLNTYGPIVVGDGAASARIYLWGSQVYDVGDGLHLYSGNSWVHSDHYMMAPDYYGTNCSCWMTSFSDERLKRDIKDLPEADGLSAIMKLRPVKFHWKDKERDATEGEQLSFIAQEAEKVLPQIVRDGKGVTIIKTDKGEERVDRPKNLFAGSLTAPLVKAVQQLKSDNDRLREKADGAMAAVQELKKTFEAYKAAHP